MPHPWPDHHALKLAQAMLGPVGKRARNKGTVRKFAAALGHSLGRFTAVHGPVHLQAGVKLGKGPTLYRAATCVTCDLHAFTGMFDDDNPALDNECVTRPLLPF